MKLKEGGSDRTIHFQFPIYEDNASSPHGPMIKELPIYGGGRVGVAYPQYTPNPNDPNDPPEELWTATSYSYELTDHLGNVRAVIQENSGAVDVTYYADYYPFGWTMPERNGGTADYRYAYQGQEKDPETGWEAFELRMYDGRVGRWMTTDPYSQYHSPYLAMGNNPVNAIDPDGGWSFSNGGDDDPPLAGDNSSITDGEETIVWSRASYAIWDSNEGLNLNETETQSGWNPLYKRDLRRYALANNLCASSTSCTHQELGRIFEDVFEDWMLTVNPAAVTAHGFRRVPLSEVWRWGGNRNTVPDFAANGGYYYISGWWFKWHPVQNTDIYELKASGGSIYLSSNVGQIRGHIQNLAALHSGHMARGLRPSVTLITTYDVRWSPSISRYAANMNVMYYHKIAQYKADEAGNWQFRYVSGARGWSF